MRSVAENGDRVQEALAAYLEYLEMGGKEPETDHLDPEEREELQGLIAALALTEGVEFGMGRDRAARERVEGAAPRQGASEHLLAQLREEAAGLAKSPDEARRVAAYLQKEETHRRAIEVLERDRPKPPPKPGVKKGVSANFW